MLPKDFIVNAIFGLLAEPPWLYIDQSATSVNMADLGQGSFNGSVPLVTATTEPETIVPPRIRSLLPTRGFIKALPPEICSLPPEVVTPSKFERRGGRRCVGQGRYRN